MYVFKQNAGIINVLAVLACLSSRSHAFAPLTKVLSVKCTAPSSSSALKDVAWVPKDDGSGTPYSERSRPYRRDVFNYDDWVRHRTSDRFAGRLAKLTRSGIARALADEVLLLAYVSSSIALFNALLVAGYDDFSGVHHDPLVYIGGLPLLSLPSMFFTLSSPALSLLLGKSVYTYIYLKVAHHICKELLCRIFLPANLCLQFSKPTRRINGGTKRGRTGELL